MKPATLLMLSLMVAAPLGLVLEDVVDQLYLHIMDLGRMLRIVSDEAYDNAVKGIMEKYEHRLRELEQKGRTETSEYREIQKRYEKFAEMYVEETDNDLEIVDYSVDLDTGTASVTLKNVDSKPIDYITGFVKVIGPDGRVSEFNAPFPVPLNLEPNEAKTYTVEIWGWDHGTYTIYAEVWRWNGDKILEATLTVDVCHCSSNFNFLHTGSLAESGRLMEAETLQELRLIYEACFRCGLPKSIQKPVNRRGRPSWNRFVLLTVLIYGLINGFSYRKMEEFCHENRDLLRELDPMWNPKRPPDHKNFHLMAKRLTVADVMRIMAKVRELKGEVPVLWY